MGTGPLRLVHFPGVADAALRLLRAAVVVLLRPLLRVALVLLAEGVAAARVLELGVSSTVPRKFYVPCGSLLIDGWHPTFLFLGS